ncbi:hypothetical protein PRK78_006583 [Emydomyces testavorans]|uniref:DUF1308 domain-containing protein n=1 Tax=Emydomyces testavorans TaxID=2070801 RepID=A0AAF0INR1_9EURO|nr:hypothetical protein PRK78_006583 [Emydomyces testavorans]
MATDPTLADLPHSTANNPHALPPPPPSPPSDSPAPIQALALATSLIAQCRVLLSELTSFQLYLASLGRPHLVELRQFKSVVQAELKSLEKLCDLANQAAAAEEDERGRLASGGVVSEEQQEEEEEEEERVRTGTESGGRGDERIDPTERKVLHSLRSSNFPFYAMVWKVAKTECVGLTAFNKKFYWQEPRRKAVVEYTNEGEGGFEQAGLSNGGIARGKSEHEATEPVSSKRNVLVDIVADHGEEWVKVSTITPTRLLFELAKQGWETDSDNGENKNEYRLQNYDSDDDIIELVKLAADMKKAAAQTRVRYKHPRIRFILPKVFEGKIPHIDRIVGKIRKAGVTVECGTIPEDLPTGSVETPSPTALETTFASLLPSPYPHRTPTLNVDCTLLLALVSDLSHIRNIAHAPHHHRAITRQIELEAEKPLVPSELWPAMGDKNLICTKEAAHRMREIVDTIGTKTEKMRTQLLMGETEEELKRETLISRFQKLSDHKVPTDWKIPIRVVNAREAIDRGFEAGQLPSIAHKVVAQLSDINTSVFVYGWVSGLMTLSSNRTVVKQIETLIEENRADDDDLSGPCVWEPEYKTERFED